MKVKVKNFEFMTNNVSALNAYVNRGGTYVKDVINNIYKTNTLTPDMEFKVVDGFYINEYTEIPYVVIKNNVGTFIARKDNLEYIKEIEDILENYGISKIIKSKNKTILITDDNEKFIITKHEDDKDDLEKAVALVMLKTNGVDMQDFYKIVESVKIGK